MKTTARPLVDAYLQELDYAARGLPPRERDELVGEIRAHITAALPSEPTEAEVRNVLERLGAPRAIAAAAGTPVQRPAQRGAREAFALVLLVTGFPPAFGWLAGVGLLLWSPLWSVRQKLLGLLVWPGGYFGLLFLGGFMITSSSGTTACVSTVASAATQCSSTHSGLPTWAGAVLAAAAFAAPLLVAAHLWRAAGRRCA